jgi:glycosyltransferase involved in cell wall biosynthesis
MHDTPSLFSDAANRSWKNHLRLAVTNRTQRKGLGSGGVTIVTSEHLKADCRKYFGVEAVIQRMGGMTLAGAAAEGSHQWKDGETLRLLSVCRIEASKRIDWLLEGLAELERRAVSPLGKRLGELVEWRLDLAGKGPQIEALREMAERLGIGGRVHFLGFVPDEELEALYGRAHLFLMPALQGYGIPAVEALSRGLPVVVHRESGVSDVLLETPWATVLFGGRENTAGALAAAIDGVLRGVALGVERPVLPTEAEWAEGVARLCGWV